MKLFEIKRQTPQWLLAEAAATKNTHLEHLEDLIFNSGYAGAVAALDYIESLRAMLGEGTGTTTKLTVKWDGSPAIICGVDPADGKFFVGTKSVFAKGTPRRCKTTKDIQEFYPEQVELQELLLAALKYLPKIGIGGVLQGDLMFTEGSVSTVNVNGEDCYVFTPNTITYAVPVNSQLGQRIAQAKLGIIFHTGYEGDSIETMKASFGVNVSGLNQHKDVWFDDATYKDYTGVASLTPSENVKISKYIAATSNTLEKINQTQFDIILHNKEFSRNIKPFINKMIRGGTHIGEPTEFLKQFITHYTNELTKDIDDPTSRKAQNRLVKIKEKEQWIADNSNTLLGILAIYKRIIELKHMVMHKLQQVEGIGTFQKTNDGYQVTTPEGFVAIGHDGGAIKLVDRLSFSRTNFMKNK
jgi:hypothetical protein